ncbi:MAG TPA: hypothetical protein VN420_02910 [Candidatus Fimivivens sp.]|nr:hypothetical protein [Candidatus Fimivivens sp.]
MEIANGSHRYRVGRQVADAGTYRLYLCTEEDTAHQRLLQVASETAHNGQLDRVAYVLSELEHRADDVEREYAGKQAGSNDRLNYGIGFPELLDTFQDDRQGGRRINVLAFRNVPDIGKMVPLGNITRHRIRPDVRTSVWIMGKLLKLLTFVHSEGISVGLVTGNNVLIEKDAHYVLVFDWSKARIHPDSVAIEARRADIVNAARTVITLLGGNPVTGDFPEDEGGRFHPYTDYLFRLACGGETRAERAHARFYELADSFWKPEYYRFTAKPL